MLPTQGDSMPMGFCCKTSLLERTIDLDLIRRRNTMTGIVVERIEQLRSVHKTRGHPVITIVGDLANNLVISGIVRSMGPDAHQAEVVKLTDSRSPELWSVISLLQELSGSNVLEFVDNEKGRAIKIYPKHDIRREGN